MRSRILLGMLATAAATAVCFVLSDTPDKAYLNPWYVDVVVSCAGAFLMWDAFRCMQGSRFWSVFFRAGIGTAIITTHLFQFLFDLARQWSNGFHPGRW